MASHNNINTNSSSSSVRGTGSLLSSALALPAPSSSSAPSSFLSSTVTVMDSNNSVATGAVSSSISQADSRSVVIPLSAGDFDMLRAGGVSFSTSSSLSVGPSLGSASTATPTTPAAVSAPDAIGDNVIFNAGSASSTGFVLNRVVDESGNVLFETVDPAEMDNQNNFLQQSQLQNHHHSQQQQQLDHSNPCIEIHSSSEISSNDQAVADSRTDLGLINLQQGMISSISNNSASNSNTSFSGVSHGTSSAAGLIQALGAVSRGAGSSRKFGIAPVEASQGESSTDTGSGVTVTFNSASSGPVGGDVTSNAQVFLNQQQQENQQQQQILLSQVANIMEAGSSSIITSTPSVNLHHGQRTVATAGRGIVTGNNVPACSNNVLGPSASSITQSSVVTVSLDQQLQQQQQHHDHQQQIWAHPNQGSFLPSQSGGNGTGGHGAVNFLTSTVDGATSSESLLTSTSQRGRQSATEVSGSYQPLGQADSGISGPFQEEHSQFTGIFNTQQQQHQEQQQQQKPQEQNSAFQAVAPSSSSTFGHTSSMDQSLPYAVIGGESEATPSHPSSSSQQQQQQQQVVVESQAVDSSSVQQEQYTLVFDAGSQVLRLQRVNSPSDYTVSQSVLNPEESEAQPMPALIPNSTQTYSQVQMNQMPTPTLTSGSSSEEVTTSCMLPPPQLQPRPSGVHFLSSRRSGNENEANSSTAALSSVMLKIEKSEMDGVPECDTTQEDLESYENESPTYMDTSDSLNNQADGLDPTAPQGSGVMSSVEVVMDSALNSNELTPLHAVAMETHSNAVLNSAAATQSGTNGGSANHAQEQQQEAAPSFQEYKDSAVAATISRQSVRKSRRLELVAQEPKASQKKRDYKSKQYDPAMLWCEDCMEAYADQCPVHRLAAVPDKIVLSRAWASCPNQMQIYRLPESQLTPDESPVGVFAKRQIPKFTQFGPFLGEPVDSLDKVTRLYFPLMLDLQTGQRQYFETADENQCNWMMFVRPARTFMEQNLVVYQHKRSVFFSSTKAIEPRQELKVWYAAHYAEQMGVKTLELTQDDIQALDEADGRFACSECARRFKSWAALQHHLSSHDEEDLDEISNGRDALLQEYTDTETDADFVPERGDVGGAEVEGGEGQGNGAVGQKKMKGTLPKNRLTPGKARMGVSDGTRKRTTYLAKTLRKYKRAQTQRPGSDKVLQGMKGMYRRRGKLSGGNEWMCTHCGLTFDNASLLNLHTLTHAAEDVGMEEIRKLAAPQAGKSISEMSSSHGPTLTTVGLGEELTIPGPASLASGEGEGGETKPVLIVACPKCNVVFNDHKDLMDHVSTHAQKPLGTEGRPFCCSHCAKSFSSAEKLARHQLVHGDESEKPLKCTVCSKGVTNNSAMACHMKTHSDRKYYDCPICHTDYDTASGLREHAQVSHADANGRFPCTACTKSFDDFGLLKKHVRTFHSDRVFQCSECSKVFPRIDKLRLHMLRHTSHREFMCETCGRQFKRKDKLKEHMKRLHGKDRGQQQMHGLGHGAVGSEDKQGQASKTAGTKFTPRVMPSEYHRFIYKCHTCLLGFKRRGMLVNHLAKRHPDVRLEQVPELNLPILKTQMDFYCQYCDKIYKSSSKRKVHIQKCHPGCAVPPSARRRLQTGSLVAGGGDSGTVGSSAGGAAAALVGSSGFNTHSFSHKVSSITTMPHGCKFCHKQYASKAKLLQHQRKQHPEVVEPRLTSRRKIKKTEPEMLQISMAGEERFESVLPITVVNQTGDGASIPPTDLLNLAMSELSYGGGAGGVTSLSSLISSLGGSGATASTVGGGGAMVHIQSSSGQLQPATIDLSQLSQLNQALHTFSVTGHQGAAVLQTPLSPNTQQQQLQQQQQQHQQLTVVTPNGPQTINISGAGGQFIARAWPANFTSQQFK